jgi:hypothetical protein
MTADTSKRSHRKHDDHKKAMVRAIARARAFAAQLREAGVIAVPVKLEQCSKAIPPVDNLNRRRLVRLALLSPAPL